VTFPCEVSATLLPESGSESRDVKQNLLYHTFKLLPKQFQPTPPLTPKKDKTGVISAQPASMQISSVHMSRPPTPISDDDLDVALAASSARHYYHGLPSSPTLIGRTNRTKRSHRSTAGQRFSYRPQKVIAPIGNHPINAVFLNVVENVKLLLEASEITWTSFDMVRIGYVDQLTPIFWVGIESGQGVTVRKGNGLAEVMHDIITRALPRIGEVFEVEIRESSAILLAGPPLLTPNYKGKPQPVILKPFGHSLGLRIASLAQSSCEGTGGFFMRETSSPSGRLFLITCRHVAQPLDFRLDAMIDAENDLDQPQQIIHLGDREFERSCEALRECADGIYSDLQEAEAEELMMRARRDVAEETWQTRKQSEINKGPGYAEKDLQEIRSAKENWEMLEKQNAALQAEIERLKTEHSVLKDFETGRLLEWKPRENRVIGELIYAPATVNGDGECHDYAVIALDETKFPGFFGNFMELTGRTSLGESSDYDVAGTNRAFVRKAKAEGYNITQDRTLLLANSLPESELSSMLDTTVLKCGLTSGWTRGRLNDVCSVKQDCYKTPDGSETYFVESVLMVIVGENGLRFSQRGDSGSAVVDKQGHLLGMILSGTAGRIGEQELDLTYAMPTDRIVKHIRKRFPDATLAQTINHV